MDLLTGTEFDALFTSFDHTAWRLETRNRYNADSEVEHVRRFLAGEPRQIYESFQVWLDMIRASTRAGKRFARVRVVSTPLTDYQRYGAAGARFNVDAGEDIRYLDAGRARELGLPEENDIWLFDSIRLVRLHFDSDDRPLGAELVDNLAETLEANRLRDAAWHYAIPYAAWIRQVDLG